MDFSERLGLGGGALADTLGLQNHLSMPSRPLKCCNLRIGTLNKIVTPEILEY